MKRPISLLILGALLGSSGCAAEKIQQAPSKPTVLRRGPDRPTIASSPEGIMRRDGIRRLQRSLRDRGFEVPLHGRYDRTTQAALLAFQRSRELAPTSMPDLLTLEELGLDPAELYSPLEERAEKGSTPEGPR